jgi:LysR family cys regulon transcriptional activator
VLVPPGHPLLKAKKLTLEAIAAFPIITYDFTFTSRTRINEAFDLMHAGQSIRTVVEFS